MHATTIARAAFPFDLRWDAQDLVDAVPLRLHQRIDFAALRQGNGESAQAREAGPWRQHGYARIAALAPHFHVN